LTALSSSIAFPEHTDRRLWSQLPSLARIREAIGDKFPNQGIVSDQYRRAAPSRQRRRAL
jgi:hypothetical protein